MRAGGWRLRLIARVRRRQRVGASTDPPANPSSRLSALRSFGAERAGERRTRASEDLNLEKSPFTRRAFLNLFGSLGARD